LVLLLNMGISSCIGHLSQQWEAGECFPGLPRCKTPSRAPGLFLLGYLPHLTYLTSGVGRQLGRDVRAKCHGHGRGGAAGRLGDEGHPLGVVEEHRPEVAARLAAVLVVDRVDGGRGVCRAAGSRDGGDEPAEGLACRDDAVVDGSGLSWIASTEMTSGDLRFVTTPSPRRAYLSAGSFGARFSTL